MLFLFHFDLFIVCNALCSWVNAASNELCVSAIFKSKSKTATTQNGNILHAPQKFHRLVFGYDGR